MARHHRKVFISYSRDDLSQVKPLVNLLKASNVDVFMDNDSIKYGDDWEKVLIQNIKSSERILVFWSKNAAKSDWVRREYTMAMNVAGVRVIPVPLDSTPLPDSLSKFQGVMELRMLVKQANSIGNPLQVLFLFGGPVILTSLLASIYIYLWSPPRAASVATTNINGHFPTPLPTPSPTPTPPFEKAYYFIAPHLLTILLLLIAAMATLWYWRRQTVMKSLERTLFTSFLR